MPKTPRLSSLIVNAECSFCGFPLLPGDRAYNANHRPYCSRDCAERDERFDVAILAERHAAEVAVREVLYAGG